MQKKSIVRLTDAERATLTEVVKKFKGSSQKLGRAQILLKAAADGPVWTDCRTKTVENIRERLVTLGFEITLNGKGRAQPPRPKRLNGEQEAKVIATRLGPPPQGFANWSLRLLADQVVALDIVPAISVRGVSPASGSISPMTRSGATSVAAWVKMSYENASPGWWSEP